MIQPPRLWPKLMFEWWKVPPADADRFWHALETSRYSRPTALRQLDYSKLPPQERLTRFREQEAAKQQR